MPVSKDGRYKISDMLEILTKVKEEKGDLPVYYASDYDWVMALSSFDVREGPAHWDGEPDEPYIYFG